MPPRPSTQACFYADWRAARAADARDGHVHDGVWKQNRTSFTDLLNQLCRGNMPAALADLGFATPAAALGFFAGLQQKLYAA